MSFPAWVPPGREGSVGNGNADVLKPGWGEQGGASGSGGGGAVPDTASSFLQGVRTQFGSVPPAGGGDGSWQQFAARQQQPQPQGVSPGGYVPPSQPQPTPDAAHHAYAAHQQPQPQPQPPQSMPMHYHPQPSQATTPYAPPQQPPQQQQQQPPRQPSPQMQMQAATPQTTAGDVQFESSVLTEEEFQSNSAIEYGSGIAMNGCTIDRHLNDGDVMPHLESLSSSVTLRITPTSIIFLHHYDRNFILEVPVTELYEITEDSDTKVVLLHTRNANGSALIELQCQSSRKRLALYKTMCIRKNCLERLKRQQQAITKAYYAQQ